MPRDLDIYIKITIYYTKRRGPRESVRHRPGPTTSAELEARMWRPDSEKEGASGFVGSFRTIAAVRWAPGPGTCVSRAPME